MQMQIFCYEPQLPPFTTYLSEEIRNIMNVGVKCGVSTPIPSTIEIFLLKNVLIRTVQR